MSVVLRQSTQIKVRIGPFVDVGDGFTPETGVALSTADEAELLKANGAATADISGATWAAVTGADGWYDLTLTTSHTDTVGELLVVVQDDSVCLPVFCRFQVVEENVYDMVYAASGDLGTTVDAILDDTGTSGVLVSSGTGSGQISLSSGAVTVGTNSDKTGYSLTNLTVQASTTLATGTHTAQTGDAYAYLGTNLGSLGANATEAGGTGDHLSAIPWNASWDAEVQSECTDALNAYDPPTNTEMTAAFTAIKGATWSSSTDTLEAIRDRGDAAWITATGFSTHSAADVWAAATRTVTAATNITSDGAAINATSGVIDQVTLVDTTTTNTDMRGTDSAFLASSAPGNLFHADIQFTRDQTNTKDEWTVAWFKNGVPITSGITSPQIQIVKRADGSDLVAATAMTQIGSTGVYKYDESTAENRVTVGEPVIAVATATIESSGRTFRCLIGRDSS